MIPPGRAVRPRVAWTLALAALLLLVLPSIASAGSVSVRIDAQVSNDRTYVEGWMRVSGVGVALVDPLEGVPAPSTDRVGQRTWVGRPEVGGVTFAEVGPGIWWFYTLMPRRYDDVGATPRHGMFANGAWYPQPLVGGELPLVEWTVLVRGPEDGLLVVGDAVGEGTVRWHGFAERVSLASVPNGRVTPIESEGVKVALVTRGPPRPALVTELNGALEGARGPLTLDGALVEAPLRRRLVRPGAQMAYVSDRLFRVTPGLYRFHRVAAARGAIDGLMPHPDPWVRSWVAAWLAQQYESRLAADGRRTLEGLAWLPTVDGLLHDGTMPFHAEVMGDAWSRDDLADDLVERYDPHSSAAAAVAQLAASVGPERMDRWVDAVLRGAPPWVAAELAGIDAALVVALRKPARNHDLSVRLDAGAGVVEIHREGPDDAPARVVVVDVDGVRSSWVAHPGPDATIVPVPPGVRRVQVDPEGWVEQLRFDNDRSPPGWTPTAAGWIDEIDLSRPDVSGVAAVWLRPTGSTRHTVSGTAFTDAETLVGATLGYTYRFGPLRDQMHRTHRAAVWLGPSVLDLGYATLDGAPFALGGGVGWSWDTRVADFAERGHRLEVWADGGVVPSADAPWGAVNAAATGLAALVPRVVIAARTSGGLAAGTVAHRLLPLGASDALRSLPSGTAIGTSRAVGTVELRCVPIRHASVPLGVVWGSELQLSGGLEAGLVDGPDGRAAAVGATAGLGLVGDVFGIEPRLVGLTAAWPMVAYGLPIERTPWPRLSLRWSQPF